jgi:hypothetical protein
MKATAVIVVILWIAGILGEIMCIYKFFSSDFEPSYKRELVYGVSAATGIGAIVGWLNIPDTKPQTTNAKN